MVNLKYNMLKTKYNKLQQDCAEWFCKWYYDDVDEDEPDFWKFYLSDAYWIGEGTVLWVWDMFINMEDIVFLYEINADRDVFHDWYWWSVEQEHKSINLKNYINLRVTNTHDEIVEFYKK